MSENRRQVKVYFNDRTDAPLAVPDQAKILASGIFAGIGVTVHWKVSARYGDQAARREGRTMEKLVPLALQQER
jgi:hypothetical protein